MLANDTVALSSTASDEWQHEIHGAVPMVLTDHSDIPTVGLLLASCLKVGIILMPFGISGC